MRKYLCKGKRHILLKRDQTGGMEIRITRNEILPRLLESKGYLCFNGSACREAAWVEEMLLWGKHRAEIMD